MEESRKQFDEWYKRATEGADAESKKAFELMMWTAWVASRSAIEIELPPRKSAYASGYGDGYLVEHQDGEAIDYEDTVKILRAAGLRVKEK